MLETSTVSSKYDCFSKCNARKDCKMISIKSNVCKLLSQIKYSVSVSLTEPCLFEKYFENYSAINANLINHWPFNNNVYDIVGGADLIEVQGVGTKSFTKDRLNTDSSALYLSYSYYKVPNGVYFNGDFTVTSWVKARSYPTWSRLIQISLPLASNGCKIFNY